MDNEHDATAHCRHGRRTNWTLIGFLAIGGYFLVTEHRAHLLPLLGYLPYLLLLACPLMHFFHHGGHGGHGSARKGTDRNRQSDRSRDQPHDATEGDS